MDRFLGANVLLYQGVVSFMPHFSAAAAGGAGANPGRDAAAVNNPIAPVPARST
jgi:hypothetical protein